MAQKEIRNCEEKICPIHKREVLFSCAHCNGELICPVCIAKKHRCHPVDLIEDVAEEKKGDIKKYIDTLEKKEMSKLQSDITSSEDLAKFSSKLSKEIERSIRHHGDEMKEEIDELTEEYVNTCKKMESDNTRLFETNHSRLQSTLERLSQEITTHKSVIDSKENVLIIETAKRMKYNIESSKIQGIKVGRFTPGTLTKNVLKEAFGTIDIEDHVQDVNQLNKSGSTCTKQSDTNQEESRRVTREEKASQNAIRERKPISYGGRTSSTLERKMKQPSNVSVNEPTTTKSLPPASDTINRDVQSGVTLDSKGSSSTNQNLSIMQMKSGQGRLNSLTSDTVNQNVQSSGTLETNKHTTGDHRGNEKDVSKQNRLHLHQRDGWQRKTHHSKVSIRSSEFMAFEPKITSECHYLGYITRILPAPEGIWISYCKSREIVLLNDKGEIKQRLSHEVNISNISMSPVTGRIWICCKEERIVSEITGTDGEFSTSFNPECLHLTDNHVIVGGTRCVAVYSLTGKELRKSSSTDATSLFVRPQRISLCPVTERMAVSDRDSVNYYKGKGSPHVLITDFQMSKIVLDIKRDRGYQSGEKNMYIDNFSPCDVVFDPNGSLIISDSESKRVILINIDERSMTTLFTDDYKIYCLGLCPFKGSLIIECNKEEGCKVLRKMNYKPN